jgi:hypothetical protein
VQRAADSGQWCPKHSELSNAVSRDKLRGMSKAVGQDTLNGENSGASMGELPRFPLLIESQAL